MKKGLIVLFFCFSTIFAGNLTVNQISSGSGLSNSGLTAGNAELYKKYLAQWNEFYQLFKIPASFEVAKDQFLLPKDNPKYKTYLNRLQTEVTDPLVKDVEEAGRTMQQNASAQPNYQLYADQSFMGLMTFGSSEVYQNFLKKQAEFANEVREIPLNTLNEFRKNDEEANEKFKCENEITGSAAEKACDESKLNWLIAKNKETAKKHYELIKPIYQKYSDEAKKAFDYYASLIKALQFPNDSQVKFIVQSNAAIVFNLLVSVELIKTCDEWYHSATFEKP